MYNQGKQRDIVLIPFPYSDLSTNQKRPALIISNNKINKTEDRICCLITRQFHSENIEIPKNKIERGGLPFKSFIKPHRIFTISEKIIIKKLCTINTEIHKKAIIQLNKYIK
jgi:mRNA interferase MazF